MTQYVLDNNGELVDQIFESLDEARDYVADDLDNETDGVRLFALGQEYDVILPSKKVLFKKKGSSDKEE